MDETKNESKQEKLKSSSYSQIDSKKENIKPYSYAKTNFPKEAIFDLKNEEYEIYMELYNSHKKHKKHKEINNKRNSLSNFNNNLQTLKDISYQVVDSHPDIYYNLFFSDHFSIRHKGDIRNLGRSNKEKQNEIDFYLNSYLTQIL